MLTFKQFLAEAISRQTRRAAAQGNRDTVLRRVRVSRSAARKRPKETNVYTDDPNDHHVTVYSKTAARTVADHIPPKIDPKTKKAVPNWKRALHAKHVAKQVGRGNKPVHDVHITPNNELEGDFSDNRERLKNLKRSVSQDVPKALKTAGAKPGNKVVANPGDTYKTGEDQSSKSGKESRARLFKKLKPNLGNLNKRTGLMVGKVDS